MSGFDLETMHVGHVEKVETGQVSFQVLRFSMSLSFHQCTVVLKIVLWDVMLCR
jgi:hypothetical protein